MILNIAFVGVWGYFLNYFLCKQSNMFNVQLVVNIMELNLWILLDVVLVDIEFCTK